MRKSTLAAGLMASFGNAHAVELFSNGPAVAGNPPISVLRAGGTMLGVGMQASQSNRVADDFTVVGGPWNVERLVFFSYQSFAGSAFTFTTATWSIVSGDVNNGTVVAFGSAVPVTNGGLAGYRVTPTTLTNTDRAIFRIEVDVPDFVLPAGSYWLRWSLAGSLASGPFAPPTADGVVGNAVQSPAGAAFASAVDGGDGLGLALPFVIDGSRPDDLFGNGFETPLPP